MAALSNDVLAERLAESDAVLAAMLYRALADAMAGEHEALAWLQGDQAAEIARWLDVTEALTKWLAEAGDDATAMRIADTGDWTITTQQAAAMLDRSESIINKRARRLRVGVIRGGRRLFNHEDIARMRADVRMRGGLR